MFTGIVEEIGTVRAIRTGKSGALLEIEASKVLEGTAVGDSIAVNGVCLTVTPGHGSFTADAMPETLRRTSLGSLSELCAHYFSELHQIQNKPFPSSIPAFFNMDWCASQPQ